MDRETALLSAEEAASALGVSRSTLYAYVSRGLIRSERAADDHRSRRYRSEDVSMLIERRENRRRPERVAEGALRWGAPVLDSGVTLIADGGLYYRGREAVSLARDGPPLAAVASLLWGPEAAAGLPAASDDPRSHRGVLRLLAADPPPRAVDGFTLALPVAAAEDPAAWDLSPGGVARSGWRILRIFVELVGHSALLALFDPGMSDDDRHAARLLRAALVLAADHELNVSTFTVRCVASAGSSPYAAVAAGLAALQGTRHGGVTERVEALLDEAPADHPGRWLASRLRRGERPPGFGHPLYPEGDPRGRALLALAEELFPDAPEAARGRAVATIVEDLLDARPTIDYGLTIVARTLGMPAGSPLTLFAIGRTIGWIAHAIEQYSSTELIRPRARYVGPLPEG